MPTPDAYAGARGGSQHPEKRRAGGHSVTLQDVTEQGANFGTYTPAIERWEHVIGRPAPAPTEPNGKNRPRLSARFVEWMMGLPEGWVTDTPGITRNEALKALGNGVVPQQGATALTHLLTTLERTTP